MNKNVLKSWTLCCIFVFLCFSFTACGNRNSGYNADETTNNAMTNDMTGNETPSVTTEHEASTGLMQDIENIGDDIMNDAQDMLDGTSTEMNNYNTATENSAIDNNATSTTDNRSR